jgi:antagonist of KipI
MERMTATAVRAGLLTTVQDLGRPGYRRFGVSLGGAVDAHALRIANLIAGNPEPAAGLEVTLGGLRLRFADDRCIAWCGGDFDVKVGDISLPAGRACGVGAGQTISFGRAKAGCRAWLAISGGIDVPVVLGSRSTDLRGGFGGMEGRALCDGDPTPLGIQTPRSEQLITALKQSPVADWGAGHEWAAPLAGSRQPMLRITRGGDWPRFSSESVRDFLTQEFTVSPDSNRMGARLGGSVLQRCDEGADLESEAVAPGTVQVPREGNPILLLADCQTIGGYPKLAHVITADLPLAAQLRPGDRARFVEIAVSEAHQLLLQRERDLARFRIGLSFRP